jgi:hypothetical protein
LGRQNVFGSNGPSEKWWQGFKTRHFEISLRRPDMLHRGCIRMANENVVSDYFALLSDVLDKENLKDKPHLIYNCDKTAINLNKSTQKVIVPIRQKHAYLRKMGSRAYLCSLLHQCSRSHPATDDNFFWGLSWGTLQQKRAR